MRLDDRELLAARAEAIKQSRLARGLPAKIEDEATYRRVGYLWQRGEGMLDGDERSEE